MAQRVVPTFLVVGAARSGTTAIAEALRAHPDVFVTRPKEPHYWALHGRPLDFAGPGDDVSVNARSVTDLDSYLRLYADAPAGAVALGDASVSSLYYHRRAIPEICRVNPAAKIVVILREPVERAYSAFSYLRTRGNEPETDFLAALDDEDRRVAAHWHHLWHYRRMSLYAESLRAYLDAFGPQRVHVAFYDDLQRDYAGTLGAITSFLGVNAPVHESDDVRRVNVSGTPRSRSAQRAVRSLTRSRYLKPVVRGVTSRAFRERLRTNLVKQGDGPPEAARQRLDPVFAADRRALAELLRGRDLPAWLTR